MNIEFFTVPGGTIGVSMIHNFITADVYFDVFASISGKRKVYHYKTYRAARNKCCSLLAKYDR